MTSKFMCNKNAIYLSETMSFDLAHIDNSISKLNDNDRVRILHKIGEARSEKLEFVPAHIKVIETVRPKYACKTCEQTGTTNHIKIAPMPSAPIPKGIATASLLSQLITAKYQYGLPLYRQETLFNDYGISLSCQTMSEWLTRCSELLTPLYDVLKNKLLEQAVIHADETRLKVIREEKSTSYMWVYCCGEDKLSNNNSKHIVLYDYHNSRAAQCPIKFLGDYSNYLQVDGYAACGKTNAVLAGCMAHARRKFIEANIKTKNHDEKYRIRQEKSKPVIDKINDWVGDNKEKIPRKVNWVKP